MSHSARSLSLFPRFSFRWVLPVTLLALGSFSHAEDTPFTAATNNAKQLFMLLVDFDQDYGSFPDATTAPKVEEATGTKASMAGKSSNSLLRQLIIGGYVNSENIFFAKGKDTKKPDNEIKDGKALAPGECGFAYITGRTTASNAGMPILAAPMIPGTTKFDRTIYDGKAVILRLDGSTKALTIAEDGHVYENGKDIFDPAQPWWGGKAPVIAYPE